MNSLRFALADSIFFPTLLQFSTDSSYTYKNRVNTTDLLNLVNKNTGEDYTPFFKLFLETTNLPNVVVDSLGYGQWQVSVPNIDFNLAMELEIDGVLTRTNIGQKPLLIESESRIIVDPNKWYLHKSDFLN